MTAGDILKELEALGTASTKKTMMNHGAREPYYGVKVEDLKKIVRRVEVNHPLALELYATGVGDAMYLAGLIADDARMTKDDLNRWVEAAYYPMLYEYTVPWVAAGSPQGRELAPHWMASPTEGTAAAGWSILSYTLSVTPDDRLDLHELERLLNAIPERLPSSPNRVRYVMNGFVIAAGCFVPALTERALKTAAKLGKVPVDMHGTSCQVPDAAAYIEKVRQRGTLGKKKKSIKC